MFKENGRLKDIRITSDSPEFDILYTFDDYVYYADIEFPQKTDKVKIEIMDVYNGSKYNDTCISGIIGKSINVDSNISDFVANFE